MRDGDRSVPSPGWRRSSSLYPALPIPSRYHFSLATPNDDPALRALLRRVEMLGSLRLSYEREPSYFGADPPLGETVQTLVAREHPGGPAIATASRATRTVFIAGEPTRIGYLSGLRVHPEHRGRALLGNGWSALRELHRADPVPWYIVSVTKENERARRLLSLGRGDAPTLVPLADVVTVALVVHRWAGGGRFSSGVLASEARRSRDGRGPWDGAEIQPRDLFPTAPLDLPGRTTDLVVSSDRQRAAAGVIWDPSSVRQTVVRGYDGTLARWRPAVNLALRGVGAQPLPEIGQPLQSVFLARPEAADARAHRALLATALGAARRAGKAFVLVGYDAADPYLRLAQRRLHVPYRSTLFAAHWPDGAPPRLRRPLHAEIATF